jgi:hypothetical protein
LLRLPSTLAQRARLAQAANAVARAARADSSQAPVAFFNASARIRGLSQNAAFSQLAAWGLRLAGVPVVHFVCRQGMSRCVLGTNPDQPEQAPPCAACIAQSERIYQGADARWFEFTPPAQLEQSLKGLDLAALQTFNYDGQPLGAIVLPSLRWALRRHDLLDDAGTRLLFRHYILSAFNLAREFSAFLDQVQPQSVVVFNGVMYPEAIARRVAQARDLRVITHEVGLQPFTAFFTEGQATAYPMEIPADFQLDEAQNAQLDAYLEDRVQGRFSMAGIQFWPEMRALDPDFLELASGFKRIVPVFTNVIYDTSQIHANAIFPHMFAWLDDLLGFIRAHPDTLFVIRAHPDEKRPGTRKVSRQSVAEWVAANAVDQLPNVHFVDATEYLSSYDLIQRSHFVMVYNSSIGLEASILGVPVLCAGAGRYTAYPTVYFPRDHAAYKQQLKALLSAARVEQPPEFVHEARRVLYFQLFRTSLPFGDFLQPGKPRGFVDLKSFPVSGLHPEQSPAIRAIHAGVVGDGPFLV